MRRKEKKRNYISRTIKYCDLEWNSNGSVVYLNREKGANKSLLSIQKVQKFSSPTWRNFLGQFSSKLFYLLKRQTGRLNQERKNKTRSEVNMVFSLNLLHCLLPKVLNLSVAMIP